MKNAKISQFWYKQATIWTFENGFTIFYSYTCPKIVQFPTGETYKFTFENSRKAWSITSSQTTSKQCNARLWYNHHELPEINLWDFERDYFDTRLEKYY